ncbi:MAG TPA: TetR family transcriptional regulator [Streptosporangiaceae bacterium]
MSRPTEIADAAIATLARDGMRGLTHRAVDRTAGLPEGSTSYYFRTRQALLQATVERLAELDVAQVPALPQHDLDAFANAATELLLNWLTTGRQRQLARYELALEATRRPELRKVLVTAGAGLRAMLAGRFAAAGVSQPADRADVFAALLDGLIFDQIAGSGTQQLTAADLRATISALISALTGRAGAPDPAAPLSSA